MSIAKKDVTPEPSSPRRVTGLEDCIKRFLDELDDVAAALERDAEWNSLFSAYGKITLIFLGAFVATKAVASGLFGVNNNVTTVIFTLAGLVIAVLAGLDAAFKWEKTAGDLKSLAATCRTSMLHGTSGLEIAREQPTDEEKRDALVKLLDSLTKNLDEIYSKSTAQGINVAREVMRMKRKREKRKKKEKEKEYKA